MSARDGECADVVGVIFEHERAAVDGDDFRRGGRRNS
jgi:hypothetical protein